MRRVFQVPNDLVRSLCQLEDFGRPVAPELASRRGGTGCVQNCVHSAPSSFVRPFHAGQIGVGVYVIGRQHQVGDLRCGSGPQLQRVDLVDQEGLLVGVERIEQVAVDNVGVKIPVDEI